MASAHVQPVCAATLNNNSDLVLALECRFAFGPAVFSIIGFFMGVLWIDSLASEVWAGQELRQGVAAGASSCVDSLLLFYKAN